MKYELSQAKSLLQKDIYEQVLALCADASTILPDAGGYNIQNVFGKQENKAADGLRKDFEERVASSKQ
jgi:hypothetical protein